MEIPIRLKSPVLAEDATAEVPSGVKGVLAVWVGVIADCGGQPFQLDGGAEARLVVDSYITWAFAGKCEKNTQELGAVGGIEASG